MWSGHELERLGDEGEDEYHEGGSCREQARGIQRTSVVQRARMAEAEKRGRDRRPEKPSGPAAEAEPDEDGHERGGDDAKAPAERRVDDVSAVELTDGNQIQRRDEEADPPGVRDGTQHDGRGVDAQ